MRPYLTAFLLGALLPGAAGATSFATPGTAATRISPSVIFLGRPAPSGAAARSTAAFGEAGPAAGSSLTPISPSVIALGARPLDIDLTRFAATGTPQQVRPRNPHLPPMVIRGGVYGDAFIRGTAAADSGSGPQAARNAARTASPAARGGTTRERQPDMPAASETPAPAAAPPRTARPE